MEPTDNLPGGHCSRSGDYGCPAGTFNQLDEQEEDLMSWLFLLDESQSPPPSSLWQSMPPAEGFAGVESSGGGRISPRDLDEMPCIPAAVAEDTTPPAPLVDTHGTGAGQLSSNFSLSSTTFDEEEVQQEMMSLEAFLYPPMAPVGLSNTTNGGPAARSHADAVPVVKQGTAAAADELPHPQPQLPLPTNNQPGGGCAWLGLSPVDEVQIQQMTPTILPSQPPSPTLVMNHPGPDEANHTAASAPMGSQGTLIPAAPQEQEDDILSRASTRGRGLPSRLQDGSGELFAMVIDMMRQFGWHIGKMMKDEEHRSKVPVWQHFWRSYCKYCYTVSVICLYCNTVIRNPLTIEMEGHLKRCLLPASSRSSKEIRSSQTLEITEIAENPNGESEPIETDNSNCATTAARVDTQGTNAGVLSPWHQHQLLMDREEQMATIFSSQPCCQGPNQTNAWEFALGMAKATNDEPDSWWDLFMRLSDSSWTTKSSRDGFRLKVSNTKETGCKIVRVHSSPAWVRVSENLYENHAGLFLRAGSDTVGSSYLSIGLRARQQRPCWPELFSLQCADPWQYTQLVLHWLGFRREFARDSVIYALGWVDACNLWSSSPRSSNNKGKSIVEQGDDGSSGKRKRKPAPPRSKVWNHCTKVVVMEAQGSKVTMARCNYCGLEQKADSAGYGTNHLKRHIRTRHPEHAESL